MEKGGEGEEGGKSDDVMIFLGGRVQGVISGGGQKLRVGFSPREWEGGGVDVEGVLRFYSLGVAGLGRKRGLGGGWSVEVRRGGLVSVAVLGGPDGGGALKRARGGRGLKKKKKGTGMGAFQNSA